MFNRIVDYQTVHVHYLEDRDSLKYLKLHCILLITETGIYS